MPTASTTLLLRADSWAPSVFLLLSLPDFDKEGHSSFRLLRDYQSSAASASFRFLNLFIWTLAAVNDCEDVGKLDF